MSPVFLSVDRIGFLFRRFFLYFLEPRRSGLTIEMRRRSRLLSAVLIILIPPIFAAIQWHWPDPRIDLLLWIAVGMLILAYTLNRIGRFRIAALAVVAWCFAMPYLALLMGEKTITLNTNSVLILTVTPLMIAYLLFSLRSFAAVFVLNILAWVTLTILSAEIKLVDIAPAIFFILTFSLLLLTGAIMRQYDLQQLQRQSAALTESEERYRNLFEATFEALVVHENGVLIDVNPAFEKLLGYSFSEAVGRPVFKFVHAKDHELIKGRIDNNIEAPDEITILCKDGRALQVEIHSKEHTYRGRKVRVVAIFDITERKHAHTREMDFAVEREKVKVLQRVISNMSHDLRTPLTVIKTSLYLMRRLSDPAKRDQQIEVIEGQVEHLKRLVEDMLSMSHLDRADPQDFDFTVCELTELLEDLIEEHQPLAERKDQGISWTFSPNLPQLTVDKTQFRRMMKHVLMNAINYTPQNGSITLEAHTTHKEVLIAVRDNGIGINAVDLPHIFDHFYRADSARSSDRGGTGLGLTIARKIARVHGGDIMVESSAGVGSLFTVRLPLLLVPNKGEDTHPSMARIPK